MEEYNLFVSRSFSAEDRELVDAVLGFCRAAGFRPLDTGRASQTLPRDKVRKAISESRAFLALLTADHATERVREWIVTEIGMAEYAGLPILLFQEEGVEYRPADHLTSHKVFSRNNPLELCREIVRALVELRTDPQLRAGNLQGAEDEPYVFAADDVDMQIQSDGRLEHSRHLLVRSQISRLMAIRPVGKTITSSRALGYFESNFDFRPASNTGSPIFDLRRNEPPEVSYQVNFAEPLEMGEQSEFTVIHTSHGSLPLSSEELAIVRSETYLRDLSRARQGHAIKTPTERLTMSLRFPEGYPLSTCRAAATVTLRDRVGDSRSAELERERIQSRFRVLHNRLELDVEYPLLDCAYYFEWTPPSSRELPGGLRGLHSTTESS